MDLPEIDILKKVYVNVCERLGGPMGVLNIKVKVNKDGAIDVNYTITGSGDKPEKIEKVSKKEKKAKPEKEPIARGPEKKVTHSNVKQVSKGKSQPKPILKKDVKNKKASKWSEIPESSDEEELVSLYSSEYESDDE